MKTIIQPFFASVLVTLVTAASLPAGPATQNTRSSARSNVNTSNNTNRSTNVNKNTNVNNNVNVNKNTNVNVNRDVNVNTHNSYNNNNGCCYHQSVGGAVAVAAAATATAVVVGSMVHTLPPSCQVVNINGVVYQQCGSTWYQPQFSDGSTSYVVINAPR